MEVKITLTKEQIDTLIIEDLKWHEAHCDVKEYQEALKIVLKYYTGEA